MDRHCSMAWGDDDGLENSGTDEVTSNNNEVDKGEITEVIEDVLEQWEDVTDDRFVTNPNTNEITNDDENENDHNNYNKKIQQQHSG